MILTLIQILPLSSSVSSNKLFLSQLPYLKIKLGYFYILFWFHSPTYLKCMGILKSHKMYLFSYQTILWVWIIWNKNTWEILLQ